MTDIVISGDVVRHALPMMAILCPDGRIVDCGRTLAKLSPGLVGQPIGDVLRIVQPGVPATYDSLTTRFGVKLRVELLREEGARPG